MLKPTQTSAVLVAAGFSVTSFQQIWLQENEILTKEELTAGEMIFTPVAVKIRTQYFEFLVVEDRVQVIVFPQVSAEEAKELFDRIFGNLLKALPGLALNAFGFNFAFKLEGSDGFNTGVRQTILSDANPLASVFDSEDSRCGFYLSKDEFGSRLRFDVKPVTVDGKDELHAAINFHWSISSANQVADSLAVFEPAANLSNDLVTSLSKAIEEKG